MDEGMVKVIGRVKKMEKWDVMEVWDKEGEEIVG